MKTLLIIDGNAIMHRAYHAIPPFKTKNGMPTNAIYGFLTMLNKAVADFKPANVVVCFDTPVPTFRKKMFAQYQSHRPKMEDNLSSQFPAVKEALDRAGVTHLEKAGYEADDVIGTLSRQFDKNEYRVLILSGDKDILQLINSNVFVITPQIGFTKQVIYDEAAVEKRFGIKPNQIPDFKALMGDQSDNYKGAKGIGPKTAAKLLQEYGSIENIFKNLKKIDGKIQAILETHKESVLMSHKLATILKNVDIKTSEKESSFSGFRPDLKDFLADYEMTSLIQRFFANQETTKIEAKKEKTLKEDKNQIGLF